MNYQEVKSDSINQKAEKKLGGKHKKITINTTLCKYDIVRECALKSGLRIVDDSVPWIIFWIDTGVCVERVLKMEPYQKINHFPGMNEICLKSNLARNIGRISRFFPKEFSFFPKTWILPVDRKDFELETKSKKFRTYICKPTNGCQGKGIFLFRSLKALQVYKESKDAVTSGMIIQHYISKPYLIDGLKFDLRLYVLVTNVDPLRVFLYDEGLARFATEPYRKPRTNNFDNLCMHLTNYAINKKSNKFNNTESGGTGSKRSVKSVMEYLVSQGQNSKKIWKKIEDIIVKTILIIQPQLCRNLQACFPGKRKSLPGSSKFEYADSNCFEILGFDIFLDNKLKPWVLEVNHSPSFSCDSAIDTEIKSGVISEAFALVGPHKESKVRFLKEQKEMILRRLQLGSESENLSPRDSVTTLRSNSIDNLGKEPNRSLKPKLRSGNKTNLEVYYERYSESMLEYLEESENSQLSHFQRIFPPDCKKKLENYLNILHKSENLSMGTNATKVRLNYIKKTLEKEGEMKNERVSTPTYRSLNAESKIRLAKSSLL